MIGYYIHHVGSGHLHRAQAIAEWTSIPVVGLSSLPKPEDWPGEWLQLARDDLGSPELDVTANEQLHWAPIGDEGLLSRAASLSAWFARHRPRLLVADVSCEVAMLARLHGIPVASMLLPGARTDDAHLLGFGVSSVLLAAWPHAAAGMLPGLPEPTARRVQHVGAISRFDVDRSKSRTTRHRRVTVLLGRGGGAPSGVALTRAQRASPSWEWTILGAGLQGWRKDPLPALLDADVVICQAGQNAIAEVAAVRRPAVVIPAERPHDEQRITARALVAGGWPVLVEDSFPQAGWTERLEAARELDGATWSSWCDGHGAERAARLLADVHDRLPAGART